ncbi:purine-nucleoside phosphorylase, partial [Acinetobacter baumannii]
SNVEGHESKLLMGYLSGVPIVCFQGRAHVYEGTPDIGLKTIIRTLKLLGAKTILITNAAGTLHTDIAPGHLMLISDHIN